MTLLFRTNPRKGKQKTKKKQKRWSHSKTLASNTDNIQIKNLYVVFHSSIILITSLCPAMEPSYAAEPTTYPVICKIISQLFFPDIHRFNTSE